MNLLFGILLSLQSSPSQAAGYHLLRLDGIYGTSSGPDVHGGFGLWPISDSVGFWMIFGDPDAPGNTQGHRVHQWFFEGEWFGPHQGDMPVDGRFVDLYDIDGELPAWLVPMSWSRMGGDALARKRFTWDPSQHLMWSLPGMFKVPARRFYLGPTAGLGLNLTWWERWKDEADETVCTGKLTGEAGAALGLHWRETLYAQGRGTFHYDLFGIHQRGLNAAAVAGVFLGKVGRPVGLEIKGELEQGNDTVTTREERTWTLRAAVYVKSQLDEEVLRGEEAEDQELRDLLEKLREAEEQDRDDGVPDT